jgi:HEPN domain-containing protein
MRGIADIKQLAWQKLHDAEMLLQSGRPDSAYYVAGYTVELLLKARICKTLKIDNFFHFDESSTKLLSKEAYRPFRVHDFSQLMVLSGIYSDFKREEPELKDHWSVVQKWKEDARYLTGKSEKEVEGFLTSVKAIATWIEKHL